MVITRIIEHIGKNNGYLLHICTNSSFNGGQLNEVYVIVFCSERVSK